MSSLRSSQLVRKARQRFEPSVARVVRYLVDGPELVHAGDPRRRAVIDSSSFAPVGLLQHGHDSEPVVIGRYCSINHKALILLDGEHQLNWVSVLNATQDDDGEWTPVPGTRTSRGPVVIGSDVYIGYEAMVMSGVTVGDGAVISARAWVARDVAPYEIVAGNPARRVGYRFDEATRAALLRIRWWDWPAETIKERSAEINSPDVEGFVRRYDPEPPEPSEAEPKGSHE